MPKRLRLSNPEKKALMCIARARASYVKAEDRVGDLRLRLNEAEQKLAKRAVRLSTAEAALAAFAATGAQPAPSEPDQVGENGASASAGATGNGASPTKRAQPRRKVSAPAET